MVCPTYVGMNRPTVLAHDRACVCPTYVGMNRPTVLAHDRACVCPTYVGMNRLPCYYYTIIYRMPHVCGDEP